MAIRASGDVPLAGAVALCYTSIGGWRCESAAMSYENAAEERRLQFLARAEEAQQKANAACDPLIQKWWHQAAEAWRYLAERHQKSHFEGLAGVGRGQKNT